MITKLIVFSPTVTGCFFGLNKFGLGDIKKFCKLVCDLFMDHKKPHRPHRPFQHNAGWEKSMDYEDGGNSYETLPVDHSSLLMNKIKK